MIQQFYTGIQLAPFVTSTILLHKSWDVIMSCYEGIISTLGEGLSWKVCREPDSDLMIIAFDVTQEYSSYLQPDLVPSSALMEKNIHHFEFLCTKRIPLFSVNNTAISLFCKNHPRLDQLRSEINSSTRLIVTGHGLGGSVASLFTISLLDSIWLGKNLPLCITFGSPLIGDKKLQQAISRSSNWNSCFLHVVSLKDPLPWLFIANHSSPDAAFTPLTNAYMPFGTFLFCSDVNSTCFENPDSVLELLMAMGAIHVRNEGFKYADYGNIVENLNHKAVCKDLTTLPENMAHPESNLVLASCISLQLRTLLGLAPHMQQQQQQNFDLNTLVPKMETLEHNFIHQKRAKFDPSKKLNLMKIEMAQLEWYKKHSKNRGIGYYDSFKMKTLRSDQDVVQYQKNLTNYWIQMVEEAEMKPQREGAAFRIRWLYAGTNCRRMVEPLEIAEYYAKGGKDYVTNQRSRHYIVLEEWLEEDKQNNPDSYGPNRRNVELLLTFDSCFWAYVEEALLLCKQLQNVQSSVTEREEAASKLLVFEEYVYGLLKKYEVSPEIFLNESSYMKWWNQYRGISGKPELASFMNNPHHYHQYTVGAYIFPEV